MAERPGWKQKSLQLQFSLYNKTVLVTYPPFTHCPLGCCSCFPWISSSSTTHFTSSLAQNHAYSGISQVSLPLNKFLSLLSIVNCLLTTRPRSSHVLPFHFLLFFHLLAASLSHGRRFYSFSISLIRKPEPSIIAAKLCSLLGLE